MSEQDEARADGTVQPAAPAGDSGEAPLLAPAATDVVDEAAAARARAAAAAAAAAEAEAEAKANAAVERRLSQLSRRGFLGLAAGGTAGVLGWRWLRTRPGEQGQPWPFRRALQMNEALWEALWDPSRLAPTYPRSAAARNPRVNGRLGLDPKADPAAWSLRVEGAAAGPLTVSLADLQALPAYDLVTELRCVEGWTIVVHWTGARLSDFMARFPPAGRDGAAADPRQPQRMPPFLALETPGAATTSGSTCRARCIRRRCSRMRSTARR